MELASNGLQGHTIVFGQLLCAFQFRMVKPLPAVVRTFQFACVDVQMAPARDVSGTNQWGSFSQL